MTVTTFPLAGMGAGPCRAGRCPIEGRATARNITMPRPQAVSIWVETCIWALLPHTMAQA